jgi:hypothetical protein
MLTAEVMYNFMTIAYLGTYTAFTDDIIRWAIKDGYNTYLQKTLPKTTHMPQIPRFGFIIRSAVIKAFPGLHVDIPFPAADAAKETRATICHLTAINDTTLMCLLDRGPEELDIIQLTQPPHQQRFSLGENISFDPKTNIPTVEFELMDLYTKNPPAGEWPRGSPTKSTVVWDPSTRCFDVGQLKTIISKYMTDNLPDYKDDDNLVTSLPIGLELNDPCYYLKYHNPKIAYASQGLRQLWKGPAPPPDSSGGGTTPMPPPNADPNLPVAKNPPSQPAPTPVPSLPPHIQTGISTSPIPKGTGPAVAGTPHIRKYNHYLFTHETLS